MRKKKYFMDMYANSHIMAWYFISTIKAFLFVDFLSILPQPFEPIFFVFRNMLMLLVLVIRPGGLLGKEA